MPGVEVSCRWLNQRIIPIHTRYAQFYGTSDRVPIEIKCLTIVLEWNLILSASISLVHVLVKNQLFWQNDFIKKVGILVLLLRQVSSSDLGVKRC